METKIVDVHIEKTAGRSKRQLFIDLFGADRVLHYDCSTDQLLYADQRFLYTEKPLHETIQNLASNKLLFPFIKTGYLALKNLEKSRGFEPEKINDNYDVITGHLTGDRFAGIIAPESARYTSVLRNPLDRTYSHYQHWVRSRGLARFRFMPKYRPDIVFEDFALSPELHNYQTTALGVDPARFAVIGLSHKLSEYFEELGVPRDTTVIPHINISTYQRAVSLDRGFISDFEQLNQSDYELYQDACDRWVTAPQELVY
jgi:hypothetical protein